LQLGRKRFSGRLAGTQIGLRRLRYIGNTHGGVNIDTDLT
jgi:hypothetical protein